MPSFQLSYCPDAVSNQLSMHFVQGSYGLRLYADTRSRAVTALPGQPNKARVTITWSDGTKDIIIADRLEGGQRLLLPDETRDEVMAALLRDESLTLTVGFCNAEIAASDFAAKFYKLSL